MDDLIIILRILKSGNAVPYKFFPRYIEKNLEQGTYTSLLIT